MFSLFFTLLFFPPPHIHTVSIDPLDVNKMLKNIKRLLPTENIKCILGKLAASDAMF